MLDTRYVPDIHWTSKYRARAGHSPYTGAENTESTFTIPDHSGVLTAFLICAGALDAGFLNIKALPTYHLEVKSSKGGIESAFTLNSAQFERVRYFFCKGVEFNAFFNVFSLINIEQARRFRLSGGTPGNVTILARVFNVNGQTKVNMFVDIWDCYVNGRLRLMAVDGFKAQIVL
jgi:hypothetical protein